MWRDMIKTVNRDSQEKKIRKMEQYLYSNAYMLPIYSPLSPFALNKEVNFVPFRNGFLNLRETSVIDNHWSLKLEND